MRWREPSTRSCPICEQRTAQLAEAEAQFRALIEQSLVGIYLTTYDRSSISTKPPWQMLGYPAAELLGRRGPLDIVHPGDRAVVERNLQRRIAGELDAVRYSLRVVRMDGGIVHLDVHGRRVLSGGRPAVLGVAVDVTQRRRDRKELQRQRETLLRSERLATIGELLGGVAHELNNPLTVILGQASLLTQMVPEGPIGERARRIQDAAERAARIVQTFLVVVRDTPLAREEVSLNRVVRRGGPAAHLPAARGDDQDRAGPVGRPTRRLGRLGTSSTRSWSTSSRTRITPSARARRRGASG